MKTMKMCCTLVGAATLLSATSVFATIAGTGSVTITDNRASLGDFWADTSPTTGPDLGSFATFCLNPEAQAGAGLAFNYTLSDSAVPGAPATSGNPNPLSIGTSYLFWNFSQGTLATIVPAYGNNQTQNSLLQQAIWYLEGDSNHTPSPGSNAYVSAAIAAYGTLAGAQADANGAYGVEVMNRIGTSYQPMLAAVPEPSTVVAGALLLLPFGVSTLRILRKKQVS